MADSSVSPENDFAVGLGKTISDEVAGAYLAMNALISAIARQPGFSKTRLRVALWGEVSRMRHKTAKACLSEFISHGTALK